MKAQPFKIYGMPQKQFLESHSNIGLPQKRPKVSQRKEIIKIKEEINKIQIKKTIKLIKPRVCSLKR